ncbi:MAG: DUF72 domain-containing protein [Chloroflexota bacterium]
MLNWYLGTMGFSYKPWQGVFYPAGLAPRHYLSYYAECFNSVEMDTTFYGTPPIERVQRWAQATPAGFKFCPKTPRAITHEALSLTHALPQMKAFVDTMRHLESKLGAILIQFPPSFAIKEKAALQAFLGQLPTDVRFTVEFRNRSWEREETAVLLAQYNICWCATDYIHLRKEVRQTTNFLYLRFIGPHGQFDTKTRERIDKTQDLKKWWGQIQTKQEYVNTIYGFFNNDYAGYSPATCNKFKRVVGLNPTDIAIWQQGRLF